MKVYISVDLEGVAGISDWAQCIPGGDDYPLGRDLALGEVNAAIDGSLEAGATQILVNDSHSFMRNLPPERTKAICDQIPLKRLGKPEEVAAFIAFLASDECSYCTGATFDISGGRATF